MLNAQTQIPSEEVTKTSKSPNVIFPTLGSTLSELDLNEQSQALKDLQTQLLQEIGSASSRGVLDPSANLDLWRKAEQRPQVDPEIFDSSQEDASPQQSEKIQIRITSSADMMRSASSTIGATQSGHLCIDPVRVDISAWSDGRSFEQQLAMLRRGLFAEFDQLDEGTAVNLTRFYLYYGFGAEALNILTLIADGAEKWPELFEMAEILEFGFSDSGQVLRQNIDCNSAGALWGILAAKKLDLDRTINVQAALRSVDSLPPHLRKFLAPELSNRLLKYGDRKGAKMAMRNLDRLSSPGDERATLASADIKISEGGLDTAGVLLNEVVNSNSEFSARALISLIETEMDTGRSIDVATANLVDAYAMELRDAPIGAELLRVHVLALAKSGQFKESFVALDDLSLDEDAKDLRTKLFQLLIADAGNAVFLELMFEYMPSLTDVNEKELVFEAAVRLHALGFSEAAEKFLDDGQALSNSNSHRILNARIALDLGRPAAADVFLVNLKGEEADLLRAKINEQKLDRIKAHEIYSQLQDTQAAQENAWLSADWQTLTDPNVAAFGSLVPVANQSLEQSENPIGMMARSKSLLDESTQVRDVISSIFQNETE